MEGTSVQNLPVQPACWMPGCLLTLIEKKVNGIALSCLEKFVDWLCTYLWCGYDQFYQARLAENAVEHTFNNCTIVDQTRGKVVTCETEESAVFCKIAGLPVMWTQRKVEDGVWRVCKAAFGKDPESEQRSYVISDREDGTYNVQLTTTKTAYESDETTTETTLYRISGPSFVARKYQTNTYAAANQDRLNKTIRDYSNNKPVQDSIIYPVRLMTEPNSNLLT